MVGETNLHGALIRHGLYIWLPAKGSKGRRSKLLTYSVGSEILRIPMHCGNQLLAHTLMSSLVPKENHDEIISLKSVTTLKLDFKPPIESLSHLPLGDLITLNEGWRSTADNTWVISLGKRFRQTTLNPRGKVEKLGTILFFTSKGQWNCTGPRIHRQILVETVKSWLNFHTNPLHSQQGKPPVSFVVQCE